MCFYYYSFFRHEENYFPSPGLRLRWSVEGRRVSHPLLAGVGPSQQRRPPNSHLYKYRRGPDSSLQGYVRIGKNK